MSLNNSGANNVTLQNSGALVLASSSVGSGTLGGHCCRWDQPERAEQPHPAGRGRDRDVQCRCRFDRLDPMRATSFTGAVSLNNSGANNVALANGGAVVLAASSVGSGTLSIYGR
ncbi:MAG: hypothetical protein WDO24_06770 [Pseudomonadota bacterium]